MTEPVTNSARVYDVPMRVPCAVVVAACVLIVGCGATIASDGSSDGSETGDGDGDSAGGLPHQQPCGFDHWELAAPLLTYHGRGHAVVALPDGTALVTGGLSEPDPPWEILATAERYDPAADEWTLVADMPVAQYFHGKVVVADGTVLAIGGVGPDLTGDRVDRYDPTLDQWSPAPSLPFEVSRPQAVAGTGNRVFLASPSGFLRSEDGGQSWSIVVDPPDTSVLDGGAFAWGEDTFVIPGRVPTFGYTEEGSRPVQLYRWSTDSWEQVPIAIATLSTQSNGVLRAYGPLSATRLLVLTETTGQHGTYDAISAQGVSFVLDRFAMDATWNSVVEGPYYYAGSGLRMPAMPYRTGWLWVGWSESHGYVYDDASDRWCWSKAPPQPVSSWYSQVTLLADGRILITGGEAQVAGASVSLAQIWSHDP